MKKRLLSIILCVSCLISLLAGCGSKDNAADNKSDSAPSTSDNVSKPTDNESKPTETTYKEELVIGIDADVDTINPYQNTNKLIAQMVYYNTHNTLVDKHVETGEIIGDLAETFEMISDTVYRFKLHEGVKFHNGEILTANDVKFSYEYALECASQKSRFAQLKEIRVIDDLTLEIELNTVNQDFWYTLAQPNISILSQKAVEELGVDGERIGTGAYKLEEWVPGQYIRVVRNEEYWGELPKTKILTYQIIKEGSARVIALQNGDIDICYSPAAIDLPYITDDPNLALMEVTGTTLFYLAMNTQKAPFDNELVRKAFAHAINKEDCVNVAWNGYASPVDTIMIPAIPLYTPIDNPIPHDPAKAKELLVEAGYPDGLEVEVYGTSAAHENVALVIQENLKQIGVTVNFVKYDTAGAMEANKSGNFEAAVQNFGNGSGPDSSFSLTVSSTGGTNRSRVNIPELDKMVAAANAETDNAKRIQMYKELNQYCSADHALIVPIAAPTTFVGIRDGLEGALYGGNNRHDFTYAYLAE